MKKEQKKRLKWCIWIFTIEKTFAVTKNDKVLRDLNWVVVLHQCITVITWTIYFYTDSANIDSIIEICSV